MRSKPPTLPAAKGWRVFYFSIKTDKKAMFKKEIGQQLERIRFKHGIRKIDFSLNRKTVYNIERGGSFVALDRYVQELEQITGKRIAPSIEEHDQSTSGQDQENE
jgi:hypothetical protein